MNMRSTGAAKVVVLLLNWNGAADTIACLNALEEISYPEWRALVVDNCSTDDSVAQITAAHPDVDLLRAGSNLGFGGGNNIGIRHAIEDGADYVWLLNTDTLPDPWALDSLVAVAEADATLGAVASVLYHLDRPDEVQAWGGGSVNLWTGMSRSALGPVEAKQLDFLSAASLLLPARAISSVVFDEGYFMYWEDVDLSFRLRRDGWRLGVAPDSRVLHRASSSLAGRSALLDRYTAASLLRFMRRYAPVPSIPIVLGLGAKVAHRAARGDWEGVTAVLHGARESLAKHG